MFSGYDSDVAREKAVDYITKIYSASIRNMSGTKPHLQHKELPVEERYYDHAVTPPDVAFRFSSIQFDLSGPPAVWAYSSRTMGCSRVS